MENIHKDVLITEANYIEDSLSALQTFLDYKLNTEMTTDDINQIVSLVIAIKLLSKKHAERMEHIQFDD